MRFDAVVTSTTSRLVLLLSGSLLTLSLAAASPAAAVTCTVKNPAPPGPNGFTTIQAAIASVAPNCTVINVKPGTYAGPISITHNLILRGASAANTTINLAGNVVNPLTAIIEVVAPATTVTIEKFTIAGPGAGGCGSLLFGILVRDGATATIKNNHITAIRDNPLSGCQNGNAIQVGRNSLGTIGHAVIEHNTIDDYQKTGIGVDGLLVGLVSTATIKDNDVIGDVSGACFPDFRCSPIAAQNGIQISRRANATISQNTIVENRYDPTIAGSGGILLFDAGDDVTVSNNKVERNDVGIWVIGTSSATILNNKVKSSTFDGIAIQHIGTNPTGSNTVSKNTATLNGNGIGLYDTDGNTIDRNIASTSEGPGIAVDATSTGNVLTQNKSIKNFTFGIEDESLGGGTAGTANTYSGNSCTGNGTAKSDPAGLSARLARSQGPDRSLRPHAGTRRGKPMRAVTFSRLGGPEVLEVSQLPEPKPGAGEVRIRVAAATVNPTDISFRSGRQLTTAQLAEMGVHPPYIPGMELAGVVDAVGDGTDWRVGDRVMAIVNPRRPGGGAQAEMIVVPAASVARVPDGTSLEAAATLPMNGLTVRLALDRLALRPGQTLGVTGAAGAVGGYAVELGVSEGLRVIAVARPQDEALVRRFGAATFIPSGDGAIRAIYDAAPGGVDGLIDAAVLDAAALPAIRDGGKLATVRGFAGPSERGITIEPVRVTSYVLNHDALDRLGQLVAAGRLTLRVAETFPPERAADAQRKMAAGGTRGRLVIVF